MRLQVKCVYKDSENRNFQGNFLSFFPVVVDNEKVQIWGVNKIDDNNSKITLEIPIEEKEIDAFKNFLKHFSWKYYGIKKFNENLIEIRYGRNTKNIIQGSSWNLAVFIALVKAIISSNNSNNNIWIATGSLKTDEGDEIGSVDFLEEKLAKMKELKDFLQNHEIGANICIPKQNTNSEVSFEKLSNLEDLFKKFSNNWEKGILNNKKFRDIFDWIYFTDGLKEKKYKRVIPCKEGIKINEVYVSKIKIKSLFPYVETEEETKEGKEIINEYFINPMKENRELSIEDFRFFGEGGIGKTTFLTKIYNEIIKTLKEEYTGYRILPIFFENISNDFKPEEEIQEILSLDKDDIKIFNKDKIRFLLFFDAIEEFNQYPDSIKDKFDNIQKQVPTYFIFSSRSNISLTEEEKELGDILGFKLEGLANINIENNGLDFRMKNILHNPLYNEIYNCLDKDKINNFKSPVMLVMYFIVKFIKDSFKDKHGSIINMYMLILGFLAFRMLYEKENSISKHISLNNYKKGNWYELKYNNNLCLYNNNSKNCESPQTHDEYICKLVESYFNNLNAPIKQEINIKTLQDEARGFLKGIANVGFIEEKENKLFFKHRIIHETFISLFITLIFIHLRNDKFWEDALKKFSAYEPTNIPEDIDNFEILAQVVLWIDTLCDKDNNKQKYIEDFLKHFEPGDENNEDISDINSLFKYVRLSRVLKYC